MVKIYLCFLTFSERKARFFVWYIEKPGRNFFFFISSKNKNKISRVLTKWESCAKIQHQSPNIIKKHGSAQFISDSKKVGKYQKIFTLHSLSQIKTFPSEKGEFLGHGPDFETKNRKSGENPFDFLEKMSKIFVILYPIYIQILIIII